MIYELDGKKPKMRDENYWIASNATVIGDVFLDTDASIWFNCVVRGDNEPISIGKGSNIQENDVVWHKNLLPDNQFSINQIFSNRTNI